MHIIFASAFFIDDDRCGLSGMPEYVYKMSTYMKKRGHDVAIVAGYSYDREWVYKGIQVYNYETAFNLEDSKTTVISARIVEREMHLQRKLKEINSNAPIDIVQYAGFSGVGFGHSLKCPAIVRLSTYSKCVYREHDLMKGKCNTYSFWERLSGKKCTGVIGPSKRIADIFAKDIERSVTLMETPFPEIDKSKWDYKPFSKLLAGKEYLLFSSSATFDKGFSVLVDALPIVLSRYENLHMVIAGWNSVTDGYDAVRTLKAKTSKFKGRVLCLGGLSHDTLFPIIDNAKALLVPSIADNFPNIALEAISLKTFVIGTREAGLEQIILDDKNGYLIDAGNSKQLIDAIDKLCTSSKQVCYDEEVEEYIKPYLPENAVTKLENYYKCMLVKR